MRITGAAAWTGGSERRRTEQRDHGSDVHPLRRHLYPAGHRGRHIAAQQSLLVRKRTPGILLGIRGVEAERTCSRGEEDHLRHQSQEEEEGRRRLVRDQRERARPLGCGEDRALRESSGLFLLM